MLNSQNIQGDKVNYKLKTIVRKYEDDKVFAGCLQENHPEGDWEHKMGDYYVLHHGPKDQPGRCSDGLAVLLSP